MSSITSIICFPPETETEKALVFEPKDRQKLQAEYVWLRQIATTTLELAKAEADEDEFQVSLWPSDLTAFLGRNLNRQFRIATLPKGVIVKVKHASTSHSIMDNPVHRPP